ncbi:RbsD/FucU family protein [Actinotalea sp.]|uniref:RbsD/FucU family protein n=1 Tax=Actinotalea sp. TaxID=1872145 RepID=UPI0035616C89
MLKGIDPLLTPELLHALAAMGHGDVIAIVDRNYPAYSAGVPVVDLPGADLVAVLGAVLSVLPVDPFAEPAARHMLQDDGAPGPAVPDAQDVLDAAEGRAVPFVGMARQEFYVAARSARVVVRTAEDRPYACVTVAKGVL